MKNSVVVALIVLLSVAVCLAKEKAPSHERKSAHKVDLAKFADGNGNLKRSELVNWELHSKFINGEIQMAEQKRDADVDIPFDLEIYTYGEGFESQFEVEEKFRFNGVPTYAGRMIQGNSKVTLTSSRYNNDGKTKLVFDINFEGEQAIPKGGAYDSLEIDIYDFQVRNRENAAWTQTNYMWAYDNTGYPTVEESYGGSDFNNNYYCDDDDNECYSYTTYNDIQGYGIVRIVTVIDIEDSGDDCPRPIHDHSLGVAACVPPPKVGSHTTKLQVGQIFQDAPSDLTTSNFHVVVKNCYGYDQKVCQKLEFPRSSGEGGPRNEDPDRDYFGPLYFNDDTQTFHFDKPCRGVPKEFPCVTTFEIELRKGECRPVKSLVLIPVNEQAIQNKYGEAECTVLPALVDASGDNDADRLFSYVKLVSECAHYEGCYSTPNDNDYSYVDDRRGALSAPFTPDQCKAICLDMGYDYAIIGDAGNHCGCKFDSSYSDGVGNSECQTPCDNSLSGENAYCGSSTASMVYNIKKCQKAEPGHHYD